jgi:hypothetical protein
MADTSKIKVSADALCNANSLRNNSLQRRSLTETVVDIIRRINQELITSHREGRHDIITSMPIVFGIPNMSNTDSQRFIYASVIDELINKGYRVWISPEKDACKIKVTWMSDTDEAEIKYQTQLIAKHTVKF